MQFTTVAVLLAATASAAVIKRDATSYAVTNFYAGCTPHSTLCSYGFTVDGATNCTLMLQGPDNLPAVQLTGCADPSYSWSVTKNDDSTLSLGITTVSTSDASTNVTGTHTIASDELSIRDGGSVQTQSYVGATEFSVDVATA